MLCRILVGLDGSTLAWSSWASGAKPTLQVFFLASVTRILLRESPVHVFLYH